MQRIFTMKIFLSCLLSTLLIPTLAISQNFSSYGDISPEEINLNECSFDKGANAVILLDEAESNYDDYAQLVTNRHIRIKILKEKGFDQANVTIHFFRKNDFETILKLEAMTTNINADGSTSSEKLNKGSFYKTNVDDHLGKWIFTFPDVKVGSIIEYKYQSVMKNYGGLRNWYFQEYIPVIRSRYTLVIAPRLEFTYSVKKQRNIPIILKQDETSAKVYFEMNNIPGLADEPYMDAREDHLQKVEFQLSGYNRYDGFGKRNFMTTWDEAIRELLLDQDFGSQVVSNIPGTKEYISKIKIMLSEEEKMKAVYDLVRNSMSWNGSNSKYARDGLKDPWKKKQGNSGEINLILINLLKDAGLDAYPMLVSERSNGKVNTQYPFIDQFNTVFACVVINGKKYYLDGRDRFTPANIIPKLILNTNALIVNKKNGGLVTIINEELAYSEYVNEQFDIDNNGKISGKVNIKSDDYAYIEKGAMLKDNGQEKYVEKNYKDDGVDIKDFEFINSNNDTSSVEEKFRFSRQLTVSGEYLYIPLNNFLGFEKNPFIEKNRSSNINFGYKRRIISTSIINLPPGYTLDALPKTVNMATPGNDILFTRELKFNKENNSMICTILIDFKKSLYTSDEYTILQQVYKKLFDYLNEPLVLKKN